MVEDIFKFTRANEAKLLSYGFEKVGDRFEYHTQILNGQFELSVYVEELSKVSTKLIDKLSGEEYVLHLVGGVGEFVGKVRAEFELALADIKDKCFEREVHKSPQAKAVIKYIHDKFGDEIEYLWQKFPTDAIWRRKDNRKWYALIMTIPKNRLGFGEDELVEVMDVRVLPEKSKQIVDNNRFFQGYHMNKVHWLTFMLDGSLQTEDIFKLIDESYDLSK